MSFRFIIYKNCVIFKSLFPILNLFLLFSCSNEKHNKQRIINHENAEIKIELPDIQAIPYSIMDYSDVYSDVRYITLESRPYATLGAITQIERTKSNDYVVFDEVRMLIVRYDSNGKFLNLIGERGNGHNEYNEPTMIAYDKYEDQVLVHDNGTKSIKVFNLDGKLIKSFKAPSWYCGIHVLDEKHLIFFFNYTTNEGNGYNYWVTDKEGNVCFKFEEIPTDYIMTLLPSNKYTFRYDGNELCCISPYSNMVYSVSSEGVAPKCLLEAKDGIWALGNPLNIEEVIKNRTHNQLQSLYFIKDKILMSFIKSQGYVIFGLFNKTGDAQWFTYMNNDIDGIITSVNWRACIDNELYAIFYPDELERRIKNLKDKSDILKETIGKMEEMSQSINPVIQICTIK